MREIAALSRTHHVTVAFLHVPIFRQPETYDDRGFYERIGPIIEATQFGHDPVDYGDAGHLNQTGTGKLSPWLAAQLAPILRGAETGAEARP